MYSRFRVKTRELYKLLLSLGYMPGQAVNLIYQLVFCKLCESRGLFFGRPLHYALELARSSGDYIKLAATLNNCFCSLPEGLNEPLPLPLDTPSVGVICEFCATLSWKQLDIMALADVYELTAADKSQTGSFYTGTATVHKLLDAAFVNELREKAKELDSKYAAQQFLVELRNLRFLDAAAGSGNLIIPAYREIKNIELDVRRRFSLTDNCAVSADYFYGLEMSEQAHKVSQYLMLLQVRACELEAGITLGEPVPMIDLSLSDSLRCADALLEPWPEQIDYIIGNPPYLHSSKLNESQKEHASGLGIGNNDFCLCWLAKADNYMSFHNEAQASFILINSVCQGSAVSFWDAHKDLCINFAYQSFKWQSSSADVSVVIVGLSHQEHQPKRLYTTSGKLIECDRINCFLQPLDEFNPQVSENSGLPEILTQRRSCNAISPSARTADRDYVRYITADAMYSDQELYTERDVAKDVVLVRTPTIIIPRHCSEQRRYIPMLYITPDELDEFACNESVFYISEASKVLFALLQSAAHQDYVQAFCGRLDMRYRYRVLLYKSFPFPAISAEQATELSALADNILSCRKLAGMPLGKMYRVNFMPQQLLAAHHKLDTYVDKLMFGKTIFRVAERVKLLAKLNKPSEEE